MRVLFCADPLQPRQVDAAYQDEYEAALSAGADVSLINFEALVYENDPDGAVKQVPAADAPALGVYRGWMLTVAQYTQLFGVLQGRGVMLINSPEQYAHCHWLPLSYAEIAPYTPKTTWTATEEFAISDLAALLEPFGNGPIIIKDYVKSRKHEWAEACFIPSTADTDAAARVVETFIARQGEDLAGGLVFREFVEFEPLSAHPKSGMPLTREFRLVFLDGEVLSASRYWDTGDYAGETPPIEKFAAIARTIPSRFFTMDVAKLKDGDWLIVELGDAQVAELPPETNPRTFYAELRTRAEAAGVSAVHL